jgi:hypothetical protein
MCSRFLVACGVHCCGIVVALSTWCCAAHPAEEPPEGEAVRVWGNLVANVERLDDELFKSLQARILQAALGLLVACSHL